MNEHNNSLLYRVIRRILNNCKRATPQIPYIENVVRALIEHERITISQDLTQKLISSMPEWLRVGKIRLNAVNIGALHILCFCQYMSFKLKICLSLFFSIPYKHVGKIIYKYRSRRHKIYVTANTCDHDCTQLLVLKSQKKFNLGLPVVAFPP